MRGDVEMWTDGEGKKEGRGKRQEREIFATERGEEDARE